MKGPEKKAGFEKWDHIESLKERFGTVQNGRVGEEWAISYCPTKAGDKFLVVKKVYPMIFHYWLSTEEARTLHNHLGKMLDIEKKNPDQTIYRPGDFIPELGRVEKNHCGLPWVAHVDGILYGVLQVGEKMVDAKTGKVLSKEDLCDRLNNVEFNYEERNK